MSGVHREWWSQQPIWLKLAFGFVALPAWLYIVVGDLARREDDRGDYVAFGLFAAVTLAFIVVELRKKRDAR